MSERIDAHHHFWEYDPAQYEWISDEMAAIRRSFLPEDLRKEIVGTGIDGVVSVQARQTVEETRWLLQLANANEFIRGVVGWVPLVSPSVSDALEEFADHSKFRAVRHVLQGEADERYMLREDFGAGIEAAGALRLVYDILIFERHLPQTIEFVDRHPSVVFVVDHVAKPRISDRAISPWREDLTRLAERENVYCKVSGMVTEADDQAWTEAELQPYLETALSAFGPRRLMFGSDWPVCLVACEYDRWFAIISRFISKLSGSEQERILGGTAAEAYNL